MSKLVRATDPTTGAEATYSEAFAKRKGLKIHADKDPVDQFGRVIRHKPRTDKAGAPASTGKPKEA